MKTFKIRKLFLANIWHCSCVRKQNVGFLEDSFHISFGFRAANILPGYLGTWLTSTSFGLLYPNPMATLISQPVLRQAGMGEHGRWVLVPADGGCGAGSPPTMLLERGSRFYALQLQKEHLAPPSRLAFGSVDLSHLQRIAARWPRYSVGSAAALAWWRGCHFPRLCSALYPDLEIKKKEGQINVNQNSIFLQWFFWKTAFSSFKLPLLLPFPAVSWHCFISEILPLFKHTLSSREEKRATSIPSFPCVSTMCSTVHQQRAGRAICEIKRARVSLDLWQQPPEMSALHSVVHH